MWTKWNSAGLILIIICWGISLIPCLCGFLLGWSLGGWLLK
jgi:hypothetical protein